MNYVALELKKMKKKFLRKEEKFYKSSMGEADLLEIILNFLDFRQLQSLCKNLIGQPVGPQVYHLTRFVWKFKLKFKY